MPKLTNYALCALVSAGLTGCAAEEYNYGTGFVAKYGDLSTNGSYVNPQTSAGNPVTPVVSQLPYASFVVSHKSDLVETESSSAKIGLLDVSSPDMGESLRVKVPYLPAFELPTRSREEVYLDSDVDRGYFGHWMDNEMSLVGNREYGEQTIHLNELGKAIKYLVFDNVRPIKALSEEVSRPVRFIFGDNAKFEINKRGDNLEAKLKFSSEFVNRWSWGYDLEFHASDDGELGAIIYFKVKTGMMDVGFRR